MDQDNLLAAVDLGSNSFRLSIGRVVQREGISQIYAQDRLKETVRLAAGLDENMILGEDAIARAIAVLERFGDRIENFPPDRVRVVATNTFRVARNIKEFLPRAEAALGYPIEVVAGHEEARLVFSGVAHELPPSDEKRLVIDIGGGSTEFIIGQHLEAKLMQSLGMGCVSFTKAYFPEGVVTAEGFAHAEIAARKELEAISKQFQRMGWAEAYGSSGTAKALVATLEESGFSEKGITLDGMQKLKKVLIRYGSAKAPELKGLKIDRMEVLPAGLSIMISAFKELKIERMLQGEGALRVGVLYDMLGRQAAVDKRDESVKQFIRRYHIDIKQATRVKQLSLQFFDQLKLEDPLAGELRQALGWAADLHEVGLSISQNAYHKHTAYVLGNADMPGFSKADQSVLSLLTLGHQGKLDKINPHTPNRSQWLALLCLRLAALFLRRRQLLNPEIVRLEVNGKTVSVIISSKWLADHPLTQYSLKLEASEWKHADAKLSFKVVPA
ncbi:Ppx/GppA family phosphatase [Advenella sp. WQ 585]|uniref:Ppx/GppA family phosphatase n=1 Tax=Advenella mandrilli TaxID=2800330 RepID=A0ABS1EA72_9BURK|nr:Ppx/GppA phosphatase family protein [Advenella mandrilli]MBK1779633.1 Ppx/GppA family phosphatase [Advenella mandrilli]